MHIGKILLFGPESRISPKIEKSFSLNKRRYKSMHDFLKKNKNYSFEAMVDAHKQRLLNNPELLKFLKSLPETEVFSYCDTEDLVLGNGISISSIDAIYPDRYLGKNIFGLSLKEAFVKLNGF